MTIVIPTLTCQKCGKSWNPRIARPKLCAHCGCRKWDCYEESREYTKKPKTQIVHKKA